MKLNKKAISVHLTIIVVVSLIITIFLVPVLELFFSEKRILCNSLKFEVKNLCINGDDKISFNINTKFLDRVLLSFDDVNSFIIDYERMDEIQLVEYTFLNGSSEITITPNVYIKHKPRGCSFQKIKLLKGEFRRC